MVGVKVGRAHAHLCRVAVALCDPIWQVTLRSSEIPRRAIYVFNFFLTEIYGLERVGRRPEKLEVVNVNVNVETIYSTPAHETSFV